MRNTPRHIVTKLTKIKDKEENLKATGKDLAVREMRWTRWERNAGATTFRRLGGGHQHQKGTSWDHVKF